MPNTEKKTSGHATPPVENILACLSRLISFHALISNNSQQCRPPPHQGQMQDLAGWPTVTCSVYYYNGARWYG